MVIFAASTTPSSDRFRPLHAQGGLKLPSPTHPNRTIPRSQAFHSVTTRDSWSTRCRKSVRSKRPEQTAVPAGRHQHRLASLSAKRSTRSDTKARGTVDRQAIAIGLSKARHAGVKLPPPKRGSVTERTRRSAKYAYEAGQGKRKVRRAPGRRTPYRARSSAKNGAPSHLRRCPGKHIPRLRGALPLNDRHRRERLRALRDGPDVLLPPKSQREKGPVANHPSTLNAGVGPRNLMVQPHRSTSYLKLTA
jgi:Family of unknown function (DUF6496)